MVWNNHIIRPITGKNAPSGRPNIMYEVPSLYGTHNCCIATIPEEVQACQDECLFREVCPCDKDVAELC
jgi:hypothetical protein